MKKTGRKQKVVEEEYDFRTPVIQRRNRHLFKPGQSGNPNGRPPLTQEQRALRKLTLAQYREVIELALTGTFKELEQFSKDKTNSAVQVGVAKLLLRAINHGDTSTFEIFTARIVGKIPEVLDINSKNLNVSADIEVRHEKVKAALTELLEKI